MTAMPNVIAFRPLPQSQPLRRPRLLIRAARAGQSGWRRERDLPRLLRCDDCPKPGAALSRLRVEEARQNAARLEGAAEYDMRRHVMLMIAILAEMRAAVEQAPVAVTLPAQAVGQTGAHPAAGAARQAAAALARIAGSLTSPGTATPAHP